MSLAKAVPTKGDRSLSIAVKNPEVRSLPLHLHPSDVLVEIQFSHVMLQPQLPAARVGR